MDTPNKRIKAKKTEVIEIGRLEKLIMMDLRIKIASYFYSTIRGELLCRNGTVAVSLFCVTTALNLYQY
jgi:hypothetical protein